jgi:hypothetical protein
LVDDMVMIIWDGYRFPMPRKIVEKLLHIKQDLFGSIDAQLKEV